MRKPFERKKPEAYVGKTYGFARVVRLHHDDPDRPFSYFFECECLKCGKHFILNQQGLKYRVVVRLVHWKPKELWIGKVKVVDTGRIRETLNGGRFH